MQGLGSEPLPARLSTPDDPAEQIFNDVGAIYNLRSYLVHGGALTKKALRKEVRKVSTALDDPLWPLATDDRVDAAMVNDHSRRAWRERWRDALASIDASASADRAPV
ncbi:hypothetical protein ACIQRW_38150 [Streptomyces sp. NPDC091287]|uniref:hypothetical protein n=1 Tax=Streptomyces sp. NPDC091287 TaxID=3365988 RepID=UPI00382D4507